MIREPTHRRLTSISKTPSVQTFITATRILEENCLPRPWLTIFPSWWLTLYVNVIYPDSIPVARPPANTFLMPSIIQHLMSTMAMYMLRRLTRILN